MSKRQLNTSARIFEIRTEDLKDPETLAKLYDQACTLKLAGRSNQAKLQFYAHVAHALRVGHDPAALLASNLYNQRTEHITDADEQRAIGLLGW